MGMPPEINLVYIYFTQIDPIKMCSFFFFFNIQKDFFLDQGW